MPTYDYKCSDCESIFEKVLPISKRKDPESEDCPNCGKSGNIKQTIGCPMVSYSYSENMKTTDGFQDRLKDIRKNLPPKYRDNISKNIR